MATKPPPPPPSCSALKSLVLLDTNWSLRIHTLAAPVIPRAALKLLELSGDGRFWFPISISLFLSPISLHSYHLYSFFLAVLLGLIFDIAMIGTVKHLVRRPRPVYNKGMGLTFSVDHWSFPSGHASRVCFVAALCYLAMGEIVAGLQQLKLRKGELVERWLGDYDDYNVLDLDIWYCYKDGIGLEFLMCISERLEFIEGFALPVFIVWLIGDQNTSSWALVLLIMLEEQTLVVYLIGK